MCDYSLQGVATSRPANIGDKLVTTEFWNTYTRGFSPVGDCKTAVCLKPGTEVAFDDEVRRQVTVFHLFRRKAKEKVAHKVARFRQINMENPHTHHDALEFPDGQLVLLHHLLPGQHATVLQLPVAKILAESKEQAVGQAISEPTVKAV
jgi:hypothetical protein